MTSVINKNEQLTDIIFKAKILLSNPEYNKGYENVKHNESIIDTVNLYYHESRKYYEHCQSLSNISPVISFIIMYSNFSAQVTNGGLNQYFDNGYANGNVGFFREKTDDISQHEILNDVYKSLKLNLTDAGKLMGHIINSFHIQYNSHEKIDEYDCCECNGKGTYLDEDGEDNIVECENCEGEGVIVEILEEAGIQNIDLLNNLDKQFEKIYIEFEQELDQYIQRFIETDGQVWIPDNKIY